MGEWQQSSYVVCVAQVPLTTAVAGACPMHPLRHPLRPHLQGISTRDMKTPHSLIPATQCPHPAEQLSLPGLQGPRHQPNVRPFLLGEAGVQHLAIRTLYLGKTATRYLSICEAIGAISLSVRHSCVAVVQTSCCHAKLWCMLDLESAMNKHQNEKLLVMASTRQSSTGCSRRWYWKIAQVKKQRMPQHCRAFAQHIKSPTEGIV